MVDPPAKSIPRSVGSPNPHRNGISSQKSLFPRRDRPLRHECAPDRPCRAARYQRPDTHAAPQAPRFLGALPHSPQIESSIPEHAARYRSLDSQAAPHAARRRFLGSIAAPRTHTPLGSRVAPRKTAVPYACRHPPPCRSLGRRAHAPRGENLGFRGVAPTDCLAQSTRSASLRAHPTGVFLSCRILYPN